MTVGEYLQTTRQMEAGRSKMMLLNLVALLAIALSSVNGECMRKSVPCLDYTVLQTHEEYEEREYPSIVWVSASAEAERKTDITRPLIKLLYAYLDRANDRRERLRMMVPVRTTKVVNGETNNYTIAFALLPEQSEDPPVPSNSSVTLTREPRTVYVVRSFSGHVRQDNMWDNQADILKNAVANDGSVDTSYYYMSIYDSPWTVDDRLNEVWMVKKE